MGKLRFRSLWPKRWLRAFAGTALLAGAISHDIHAQQPILLAPEVPLLAEPPKDPVKDKIDPMPVPKKDEKPMKKFSVALEGKDWQGALDWFSEISGLPFVSNHKPPTGSVNLTLPKIDGKTKQCTIPEILDHFNDLLLEKGFILIRRDASFGLLPVDDKPDATSLRQVNEDELDQQAQREMVRVIVQLKIFPVDDVAPQIKKMLGKFSDVQTLSLANQLILADQVGNLRRVIANIRQGEKEMGEGETYRVQLKYTKARIVEETLVKVIGDPKASLQAVLGGQQPQGGGNPGQFDPRRPMQPMSTTPPAQSPSATGRMRAFSFVADERLNTIIVSGPPDIIGKAKKVVEELDRAQLGQQPIIIAEPFMKSYSTTPGTADTLAKSLIDILKPGANMRIWAVGQNEIYVWAGPQDHIEVVKILKGAEPAKVIVTKLVPLSSYDAAKLSDDLKKMFGETTKGGPFIAYDERNNIIIKGTQEQVADVEATVKVITGEGSGAVGVGSKRIMMPLKDTSARNVAEAMELLLKDMGYNPKVIKPGLEDPGTLPSPIPKKEPPLKDKKPTASLPDYDQKFRMVSSGQFVDPRDPKKEAPKTEKPPIILMGVGNRLLIQSDDPAITAMAAEMARLIVQPAGDGDYSVIRLKNANATNVARVLDAWFNNKEETQPQQNRQGGGGGPFGGGGGPFGGGGRGGGFPGFGGAAPAADTTPQKTRVRILAHTESNSLLVRASIVDLLTIKTMLKDVLDRGDADSGALVKLHPAIKMKYAIASEVASIVRDVYRESTNQATTQGSTPGGFPGFAFGQPRATPVDSSGVGKVVLSVGVDERTNTMFINSTQALYDQIVTLSDYLEESAKDSSRKVEIVQVKGIDPALIQQAIDAMQGRRTSTTRTGTGGATPGTGGGFPGGGGGFPGGGGGFPGGGFNPGGGGGRGGGGMRPGGGGQAPSSEPDSERGPDFFEQADKDVPSRSRFYDPRYDNIKLASYQELPTVPGLKFPPEAQAAFQDDLKKNPIDPKQGKDPKDPKDLPPKKIGAEEIRGPRATVNAVPLTELGIVVISTNNADDLVEVMKLIAYLKTIQADAQVSLEVVPLEYADAVSVVNILNQIYSRLTVTTGGNITITPPRNTGGGAPQGGGNQPGGGFPQGGPQPPGQQQQQQGGANNQQLQPTSLLLIPLPRFNSIFLGAPKGRVEDIIKEIRKLDRPVSDQSKAKYFQLRKASAQVVATMLQQFYAQRYPGEGALQNAVRITFDTSSNQVVVQAGPTDLEEIKGLIERIDSTVSSAVNELRVVRLRNAYADDLSTVLQNALIQGILPQSTSFGGVTTNTGGGGGGGGQIAGPGGQGGGGPGGIGGANRTTTSQGTNATKTVSLRFISNGKDTPLESGLVEDVHLTADTRTNSLIISAPPKTMPLLLALVQDLDITSAAKASINIFTLKKADAVLTGNLLQNLFYGGGTSNTTGGGGGGTTGFGGNGGGGAGATSSSGNTTRPLLSLTGQPSDGANLIAIRIGVDDRTNSVIVAGSPNDLDTVAAIIDRLESSDTQPRINEVVKLRNSAAADVATALQTFYTNSVAVISTATQLTPFQETQRAVVLVPEPVTNTIMISATPQYYEQVLRMLERLDAEPAQVMIEVLIAEVQLTNSEEFGIELGLQNPLMYQRSILPTSGTTSIANSAATNVPSGVTVSTTLPNAAFPGYNFNTTTQLPGYNTAGSGLVGLQGLGNLGVGRAGASGIGGFVFSAASDSVSVLVRALKQQGRLDVLNTPNLTVLDNQTGYVQVGQSFPYVTGGTVSSLGTFSPSVNYQPTGVTMRITPRISPDGKVLMRAEPSIVSPNTSQISLGNGILATAFDIQTVQTTILAGDGETVVIGGLITKSNQRNENKIPLVGDLPYVGALFRYRTQQLSKRELVIILTPHIVRCAADADRYSLDHIKRMHWSQPEVEKLYGTDKPLIRGELPGVGPGPDSLLAPPAQTITPTQPLPQPKPATGGMSKATEAGPTAAEGVVLPTSSEQAPASNQTTTPTPTVADKPKEKRGWSLFRRGD